MRFALGPRAVEAGHRLIVHDRLDSSNSEALRLARSGEQGPLWIIAREQTAGRGRRGREWFSADGNLAASLLFVVAVTPPVAATLGFVASLAVHGACRTLAPEVDVALKWPNDVLADGGKVAGLLLESEVQNSSMAMVVGIGVNLASAPDGMPFPAQSLRALGHDVPAEQAFVALTDAWVSFADRWNGGRGFDVIRKAWLAQARGIGQSISVRTGERVENGIFETLDEEGRLVLRAADGTARVISAGDVYFGDAASAVSPRAGAAS
jgi:BirA family biotin operon repressor/biotin-[acetyl-CoA-carboxylase] ligase